MEPKDYVVTRIEGEYAYLREENGNGEELFIALFLLPLGISITAIKSSTVILSSSKSCQGFIFKPP